jgi:hypothetical protein
MANLITIKVKGMEAVGNAIKAQEKKVVDFLQDQIQEFTVGTHNMASRLAPVDEGGLKQKIQFSVGVLTGKVNVNIFYAAFQEFGTGKYARAYVPGLPAEWRDLAAQFKGRNIEGGIKEHPYLYEPVTQNQKKLVDNLKAKL